MGIGHWLSATVLDEGDYSVSGYYLLPPSGNPDKNIVGVFQTILFVVLLPNDV
ncbi:MAG: hypothetical protein NZ901_00510 [Geminocystis sp.]|nr:hypothetical protein [Geminocystis sp.]HIK38257.1 hypothetical protein [Geminocystis sp. M7585_C2015_104]MCS7146650.1 hypothetical protein [Geminocystis sp.]MCX8077201.1 hypothetical protein [Geminocystis sp.]MDW8115476.1 hypothetical protein [Geminocystis sp.]